MKKTNLSTFSVLVLLAVLMVSCGGASTPKTSLKTSVDSVSYAYGVTMADQGLSQFLEQAGVLLNTNVPYTLPVSKGLTIPTFHSAPSSLFPMVTIFPPRLNIPLSI